MFWCMHVKATRQIHSEGSFSNSLYIPGGKFHSILRMGRLNFIHVTFQLFIIGFSVFQFTLDFQQKQKHANALLVLFGWPGICELVLRCAAGTINSPFLSLLRVFYQRERGRGTLLGSPNCGVNFTVHCTANQLRQVSFSKNYTPIGTVSVCSP